VRQATIKVDFNLTEFTVSPPDLPTPCFVPIRYRPGNLGTWSGHLAFAHDLIADLRPSLLVELGTHWGESYFTFCQSVFQNRVDCVCYAVDHWLGEPHAGHYGEEVFADVQQFNERHYRGFSYLLRTGFDEAREQFADESIDLLHIDGLHTYEAVSHDFHTWLPKVKPGGLILMHDIAVRHADFGVWRLWDELKNEFALRFEFHHWWGLGVLQKPGGERAPSAFLDLLFHSSAAMAERIRRHYLMQTAYLENTQGAAVEAPARVSVAAAEAEQTAVQIFPAGAAGYSEETSLRQTIAFDEWNDVSFALPAGTGGGPLRIDPSDCVSVIEIKRIALLDEASGVALFRASSAEDFEDFQFSECAGRIEDGDGCCLFSCSSDPYLVLPGSWRSDTAVRLDMTIRVQTSLRAGAAAFQASRRGMAAHVKEELDAAEARLRNEAGRLQMALAEAEQRRADAVAEAERLENLLAATTVRMRQEAQREVRILQELLDSAEDRVKEEARKLDRVAVMEKELLSTREALENERALLVNERTLRARMLHSKSWVVTKPLRGFMNLFKGGD
jgi:hypothetical protein